MGFFSLFGGGGDAKIPAMLERNAVVLDVRTPAEFKNGHPKGALNIPLNRVESEMAKIKKMNRPVITCCASGARSGSAAMMLRKNGIECINGGPWQSVHAHIK